MWRLAIPVIILILSTICFEAGVTVQHRPNIAKEGMFMHVLYAMSLFKVNGINLGMPIDGPIWAIDILYVMYFAAPAVSISAILEAVFRVARLRLRWTLLRGRHAVVIGAGRATVDVPAIIDAEVRRRKWHGLGFFQMPVVIVDRSEEALLRNSTRRFKMQLDANDPQLVDVLNLHRAKIVMFLTNDDQANIDGYFRLREKLKDVREQDRPLIFVRVSDMDLMRILRTYNTSPKTRFFNVYIEGVRSLFELEGQTLKSNWLTAIHESNPAIAKNWKALAQVHKKQPRRIVFVGFGRFGQHLLVEMMRHNLGHMIQNAESITIISPDVHHSWAHFERLVLSNVNESITIPKPDLIVGNHNEVGIFHRLAQDASAGETLWIIGTGDTHTNIQASSVIQKFCGTHAEGSTCDTTILVRTTMFSMAHDRLLDSGRSDGHSYILIPTYHIIGAYFSRRIRQGL